MVDSKENKKKTSLISSFIKFTIILIIILFLTDFVYKTWLNSSSQTFQAFQKVQVKIDFSKARSIINLKFQSKDFKLAHFSGNNNKDVGIFEKLFNKNSITWEQNTEEFSIKKENDILLKITKLNKEKNNDSVECHQVTIESQYNSLEESVACFYLNPNYWFGGHESYSQPFWPINNQSFDYQPYITGWPDGWAGVLERYWLSSNGTAIFLNEDMPLLVRHVNPDEICLMSNKSATPYAYTPNAFNDSSLNYFICTAANTTVLHTYMINHFIGTPNFYPDTTMILEPVWTTWSFYHILIDQSIVLNYAKEIADHNYPRSNLEIDDRWETMYGDLDFDKVTFPDMANLTQQLHDLDFRVTLWVHPFCNIEALCFVPGVENGYWVKNANGDFPGVTSWWDGKYAAILDTTNPNATEYFVKKLNFLRINYYIDGFKFDAGEQKWLPKEFNLCDKKANPNKYSANYVRTAATNFGILQEARVGARTQDVGIFYRILDRATDWTIQDGIKSVITATLQFGILGYPYVLPDIIFGNGGPMENRNKKELFIRWTQLTTFLTAMQFSIPPWYFDNQTDIICLNLVNFRIKSGLGFYIEKLASRLDGIPIIRPMWWNNSNADASVFTISDQFMVGDEVVVAPILDEGVTSRNIYLPGGKWLDVKSNSTILGPAWLSNYQAPLEIIPYFILEDGEMRKAPFFFKKTE